MKKELRNEYKQKKFKIGVFQIRNTVNEKTFIGSSVNMDAIWNRNRMELNFGGHRNEALQADWKKFGEEAFRFEILSEIKQEDNQADYSREAKKLEEMFIEELQPFADKGYNRPKR
jgi:hypothetical protein